MFQRQRCVGVGFVLEVLEQAKVAKFPGHLTVLFLGEYVLRL